MRHTRGDRGHKSLLHKHDPELATAIGACSASGYSSREIAAMLGITPETIKKWVRRGREAIDGPYRRFYLEYDAGCKRYVYDVTTRRDRRLDDD
jgi:IS30 family transposase